MSELSELISERERLQAELQEIESLSEEGRTKILEAVNKQRWYFFRNKPKVILDRLTGLLWANLNYFPYKNKNDVNGHYSRYVANESIASFGAAANVNGTWVLPTFDEFKYMVSSHTFPFQDKGSYTVKEARYWYADMTGRSGDGIDLGDLNPEGGVYYVLPCNRSLTEGTTYAQNVAPDNKVYSANERAQFTINLFTQNDLLPKFDDDKITELYDKIYVRKPEIEKRLQELNEQIDELQAVRVLSSEFDYTAMLADYDLSAINSSVIKYFQALRKWTDSLMSMIEVYEREKEETISRSNTITLQLSKKYKESSELSDAENELLRERTAFFRRKLSLGMNTVKTKILAVKQQADELEERIDSTDSLTELAAIAREERACFALAAENTARIIMNALLKIEFFESHSEFVTNAVKILSEWTENYRVFKTTYRNDLEKTCNDDGIDKDIWESWYSDWEGLRLEIERKLQPVIEWGLKGDTAVNESADLSIPEQIITVLEGYKKSADKFFLEERKGIYQKFAFAPGGKLQEKFEAESMLYKCALKFQSDLQRIIFSCTSPADRIFILNWADSLLDIHIDEILTFVADKGLDKISGEILDDFAKLKQKNYDVFLSDAKAYGEELSRREKQYNSLMFRMRSDLAKGEVK